MTPEQRRAVIEELLADYEQSVAASREWHKQWCWRRGLDFVDEDGEVHSPPQAA